MEAAAQSQLKGTHPGAGRWRLAASTVLALGAGFALRAWMLSKFFQANGDTLVYGGIAKNLLLHGRYALTLESGQTFSTLIRLPGYPLFLAACFRLFGMENYGAVAWVQIALELIGCLLLADFARRIAPARYRTAAAQGTLWLAALCPFTAVYAATPLAEGPTLFVLALALWAAARFTEKPGWGAALWFTFAVTYAALLRPDGALAAVVLAPALLAGVRSGAKAAAVRWVRMAVVCGLLALTPFGIWTWRNWQVFHVVQPLVPESATDPGDPTTPGWDHWVKTWSLDFVSTYEVYWNVPDDELDVRDLPSRAFDTQSEHAETAALAADYNNNGYDLTPEMDARFERLAEERAAAHPFRTYVELPLGRVADMWLRPRVENLPIDLDWWVYAHHNAETRFSWFYAGLNAFYLVLGIAGMWLRPKMGQWMLAYMLLRSVLLLTVVAPEARYTLECFPMLFALGGVAIGGAYSRIVAFSRTRA
ncbi:MAG: glycosyltransferase family 39 protein [Terracidiphilus sp.]